MTYDNRKEFTDATIGGFAYGRVLFILAAVFIWFLYAIVDYSKLLKFKAADIFTVSFLSTAVSVLFLMIVSFVFLRKYWIFKVITDDRGLTFVHLLKEEFIRWDQVTAVGVGDSLLMGNVAKGKAGEVKTRERHYNFPLTMKEKGQMYPLFSGEFGKFYWKDKIGNKLPIDADNCTLYNEIRKHIRN
ncbi:MAG: hypothetical protein EPN25_10685 [Nitrospirae bacterium]|nr:MAG: hypothetical protein EPN25_10685 [Nitrospirota bacterium]